MYPHKKKAFTLIELLVVVAIIAVLIAILIPSLGKARDRAKAVACASNERSMYQGIALYAADFNGAMVPCVASYRGLTQKNCYWFGPQLLGYEWGKNGGLAADNKNGGNYLNDSYWSVQEKYLHCPADPTSGEEYFGPNNGTMTGWTQRSHGYTITDYAYNANMGLYYWNKKPPMTKTILKFGEVPPNTLLVIETHQGINVKGDKDYEFASISDLFVYDNVQNGGRGTSPLAGRIHQGGTSANMLWADGRIILADPLKMNTTNGAIQPTDQPGGTAGTDFPDLVDPTKPSTHQFPYP